MIPAIEYWQHPLNFPNAFLFYVYIVPNTTWKMSRMISKMIHSKIMISGIYHQSFLKLAHLKASTVKCIPIWQAMEASPTTIDQKMQRYHLFHCMRKYESSYRIQVTMNTTGAETRKEISHLPLSPESMFSERGSDMLMRATISTQKKNIE